MIDQIMTNIIIFIIIIYNNSTSSKVLTFAGPVLWAGHYAVIHMDYIMYIMPLR